MRSSLASQARTAIASRSANDLVDRLNLWAFPVLLGSGKRLFAEGTVPTALRLVESATFPKGAVHLTYERAGKPTFGSMA